jgi:hypothetical protein
MKITTVRTKYENMKIRKYENAETWKCKMYFMMSRLGHRIKGSGATFEIAKATTLNQ